MKKLTVFLVLCVLIQCFGFAVFAEEEAAKEEIVITQADIEEESVQESTEASEEKDVESGAETEESVDTDEEQISEELINEEEIITEEEQEIIVEESEKQDPEDDITETDDEIGLVELKPGTVLYLDESLEEQVAITDRSVIVYAHSADDEIVNISFAVVDEMGGKICKDGYVSAESVVYISEEKINEWQNTEHAEYIQYGEWILEPIILSELPLKEEDSDIDIVADEEDSENNIVFDFGIDDLEFDLGTDGEEIENSLEFNEDSLLDDISDTQDDENLISSVSIVFDEGLDEDINDDEEIRLAFLAEGAILYSDESLNQSVMFETQEDAVVEVLKEIDDVAQVRYTVSEDVFEVYARITDLIYLTDEEISTRKESNLETESIVSELALEDVTIETSLSLFAIASEFIVDSDGYIIEYKGNQTAITLPTVVDGKNVIGLADTAFSRNTTVQYITIPYGVDLIYDGAFKGCTSLISVSMNNQITYIPAEAFQGCTSLQSVSWPQNLTRIEHDAFEGCTGMAGVALPENITYIGDNAFANCTNLAYVDWPSTVTEIGSGAFRGCSALKEIIIPNSVETIGNSAFEGCTSAGTLTLPINAQFKEVKNFSFKGCSGLNDVVIPGSVETIGREAFYQCTSMTSVDIPNSVNNVGARAFAELASEPFFMIYTGNAVFGENALGSAGYVLGYKDSSAEEYSESRTGMTFRSVLMVGYVRNCYVSILGRTVDRAGLLSQVKALAKRTSTGVSLVSDLFQSKEFSKRRVGGSAISEYDSVELAYAALMGVSPSTTVKENYQQYIVDGVSIYYVANTIAQTYDYEIRCNNLDILPGTLTLTQNRDKNRAVSAFVSRCYSKLLGRTTTVAYDIDGINDWTGRLLNKTATGADIIIGFTHSKEFTHQGLSDTDSVTRLYNTMLDRIPDGSGLSYWVYNCLGQGTSLDFVVNGFSNSREFMNLCAAAGINYGSVSLTEARDINLGVTQFVFRCYTQGLSRNPDIPGLNNWCAALNGRTRSAAEVAREFALSVEATGKYTTNSAFIQMMYWLCFDRAYDTTGYNTWINYMSHGATRSMVIEGFTTSQEFRNMVNRFGVR